MVSRVLLKRFLKSFLGYRGSLLLEIAIALSVIGLVSSFFITKSITANRAARESRTRNNIEIVTAALASYLAMNKRLPRPAISGVSGTKGLESSNPRCVFGTVPYNTLGIAERNTLDGKGRPLVYLVNQELTDHFDSIYLDQNKVGDCLELPKFFCDSSILSKIKIESHPENGDIVAFVIDTADSPLQRSEKGTSIVVKPGPNTFWIHRNFLLIHYLKGCPCDRENQKNE